MLQVQGTEEGRAPGSLLWGRESISELVTQQGRALAQDFDRSRSGRGWDQVPAHLPTGNEDACASAGASAALGGKAWLILPRLKQKGPAMALGLRDFIASALYNFLPSRRQGAQQAKQIRGCNVILDICSLENEFTLRAQAVIFWFII